VPTTTGYNTDGAGGNVTISGFSPTGVTCASGYEGTVSYTVCGSAGAAYSVSGCQAREPTSHATYTAENPYEERKRKFPVKAQA